MAAIDRIGPSDELLGLLKEFANKLNDARDLWDRIRLEGANEGFDEHQLAEMVRPYLKERRLTEQQIWYLFHRDEQRQRSQDQYRRLTTNIRGSDRNNDLEESSSNVRSPITGKVIDQNTSSKATTGPSPASSGEEIEIVEYDLAQAWGLLKDHVSKFQKNNRSSWIVKMYIKDGLVKKIENEMFGYTKEDSTI